MTERDRTIATSSDGVSYSLQKTRPLNGRTTGPTRRSTKGQWTAEEDEILRKAVERFKGKNWKKIAECFKDRTDVQCLHRWQKVLDPELVKGPWSKEEDEAIIELVKKYGPKKWSTISQHLPGRIGKQCRERWHNHLNPSINKQAWTQEEELALIRAHQIYGNKWAELSKFLPGRTDNSIKNHWNSSVKKKLDSYLASGLLTQFQGLPLASQLNQSLPSSSSTVQQSSGDDSIPKDGTEAEEISECSQGSTIVGCSQSVSHMGTAVAQLREECQLTEESSHGKDPSCNPVSCSENYHTSFEGIVFSLPEVPCEMVGSAKYPDNRFAHDWGSCSGKDWQLDSNESPNITQLDLGQGSSEFLMHCISNNENHGEVPFPLHSSVNLSACPSGNNMGIEPDKQEQPISDDGRGGVIYPEGERDGHFYTGNIAKCSNVCGFNGSIDSLIYQTSNYQVAETAVTSASHSYCPSRTDMLGAACPQSFVVPPQLSADDSAMFFGSDPNQFNDLSLGNQEEELIKTPNGGFIYANDTVNSQCDNGTNYNGLHDQSDHTNDFIKLVPVDAFSSGLSNDIHTCSSVDDIPTVTTEEKDAGALFYEPPRFPSLDIPFFSCDLVHSGNDTLPEYSPLGIRQLMMSTMNCVTPFRLWDSPSRDDSPDVLLRSAAKTFTSTPSILKKRNRDLVSPMSEKRSEKKLEIDMNHESFCSLAKDFSRLDVMFHENGNDRASLLSPSSNRKGKSENSANRKENMNHPVGAGKEEDRDSTFDHIKTGTESDSCNPQEKIKEGIASVDAKTGVDSEFETQNVQQPLGVLVEHNRNDLQFFSPDRIVIKSDRSLGHRSSGNQCSSKLEPVSTQAAKSDPASNRVEVMSGSSGNEAGAENLSIFGETPFKRSFESPSAWKSPWFINSFVPGPRIDTDITVEDIGFFLSPGDRSYDAIGLMKQLSEHTAPAFADAQEILGDETPESIIKGRCSKNHKKEQDSSSVLESLPENHSPLTSNLLTERRVLDFSECGTPGKAKESKKYSTTMSFSSPSSYLLKSCR